MVRNGLITVHPPSARALTGGGRDGRVSRPAPSATRPGPSLTRSTPSVTTRGKPARGKRRSGGRNARDRGSVAVEFALVLPLLLLIVFGIIDFGRALNAQITLTEAAREGARLAALGQPNVVSRTQAAATGLSPVSVTVTSCPFGAGASDDASVTVSYQFTFITPIGAIAGLFGGGPGSPLTMTATGVMPCET
jgi:Flp pilus assembly protein TadG